MNILRQTGFLILLAALGTQHPKQHVRAEDPMNPCIDPMVLKLTHTDGIIMVYYHDGSWTGMIEGYDGWVSFDGERWFKSDHPYVPKCEPEAGGEGRVPNPRRTKSVLSHHRWMHLSMMNLKPLSSPCWTTDTPWRRQKITWKACGFQTLRRKSTSRIELHRITTSMIS